MGWVGALSLFYNFFLQPFLVFILLAFDYDIAPPELDLYEINSILLGMLGMSTMRTYEKIKLLKKINYAEIIIYN